MNEIDNYIDMPAAWNGSEQANTAIRKMVNMPLKHGLMANIPIVCRAERCPYSEVCPLEEDERPYEERCPVEVAAILQRFNGYMNTMKIDPENLVDLSLVKNLVDIEIQILRADSKLASSGDFIDEVITAISNQGVPYSKPEINKAAEFKLKLIGEHAKMLSLLNATRKDKAANKININVDASTYAAELLERKRQLEAEGAFVDVTPSSPQLQGRVPPPAPTFLFEVSVLEINRPPTGTEDIGKFGKTVKAGGIGLVAIFAGAQVLDIAKGNKEKLEAIRMTKEAEREMARRKKKEDKMTRELLMSNAYNILPGLPGNDMGGIVLDMWKNRTGHTRF